MTPLDFFLCGYLKDKVYQRNLATVLDLKNAICYEIDQIRAQPELLKRVCAAVTARVKECIDADGGHFEFKH